MTDNPFEVGDMVYHRVSGTYTITRIQGDGWCSGAIPGGGWHYSKLSLVTEAPFNLTTGG
jgi:hypothetical protein